MRNSTFFRPTQPVTYQPYFEHVPTPSADDPVFIDSPAGGDIVNDPIVIRGRLRKDVDPVTVDLMIGFTPVANLNQSGIFEDDTFTWIVPVPFLTDGAHTLWARTPPSTQGWAHRDVHFWRSEIAE